MLPQGSGGFNPNDPLYRTCCCHTKTFTIVTGILEIFTICFILVAIIPDVNSRICDKKPENGDYNITDGKNSSLNWTVPTTTTTKAPTTTTEAINYNVSEEYRGRMDGFRRFVCEMNLGWLISSILDIISINLTFYAIKTVRWLLFIPHLCFRVVIIGVFILGICLEVYAIVEGGASPSATTVGIVFTAMGGLFFVFVTVAEVKCAHFIKRSQETGYSISVARPIVPQTISVNEQQQQGVNNARAALPPLRHTYGNAAAKYAE